MFLQTLVQLHILLSAAPALAGWTLCACHPPAAPVQAVRSACRVTAHASGSAAVKTHVLLPGSTAGAGMFAGTNTAADDAKTTHDRPVMAAQIQPLSISPKAPRAP